MIFFLKEHIIILLCDMNWNQFLRNRRVSTWTDCCWKQKKKKVSKIKMKLKKKSKKQTNYLRLRSVLFSDFDKTIAKHFVAISYQLGNRRLRAWKKNEIDFFPLFFKKKKTTRHSFALLAKKISTIYDRQVLWDKHISIVKWLWWQ